MKAAIISTGTESSKLILEAAKKYFTIVEDIDIKKIKMNMAEKGYEIIYDSEPFPKVDCIYIRGNKRFSALLSSFADVYSNECYMPIRSDSLSTGFDDLLVLKALKSKNIPLPQTQVCACPTAVKKIQRKWNYPVIVKQGKNTADVADDIESLSLIMAKLNQERPFIIQGYIETGGVDIRALVIGERVVSVMKRAMADKTKVEACDLNPEAVRIAVEAAKAVGAEICIIEMLEGVKGHVVTGVNLSPAVDGLIKATKIDSADEIAKHLFESTRELLSKRQS